MALVRWMLGNLLDAGIPDTDNAMQVDVYSDPSSIKYAAMAVLETVILVLGKLCLMCSPLTAV
jgi:hypothetical protein